MYVFDEAHHVEDVSGTGDLSELCRAQAVRAYKGISIHALTKRYILGEKASPLLELLDRSEPIRTLFSETLLTHYCPVRAWSAPLTALMAIHTLVASSGTAWERRDASPSSCHAAQSASSKEDQS